MSDSRQLLGMSFAILSFSVLQLFTVALIFSTRKEFMAAIDDLKSAVAEETADIALVSQALTDETARVDAALAALPTTGATDEQIAAVTADITTHNQNLKTIAAALAQVAANNTPDPNAPAA